MSDTVEPELWGMVDGALRRRVGEDCYQSWIAALRCESVVDGVVTMKTPSRVSLRHVEADLASDILDAWRWAEPSIRKVRFEVDQAAAAQEATGTQGRSRAVAGGGRRAAAASTGGRPLRRLSDIDASDAPSFAPSGPAHAVRPLTFDDFVVGDANQVVFHAAKKFAEVDEPDARVLLIVGGCGLGKSHILNAIQAHRSEIAPDEDVHLIAADAFLSDFVNACKTNATGDFKAGHRQADLLLLDDLQHVAGKTKTQEELTHTIEAILNRGGRVVATCEYAPSTEHGLDMRLVSRLRGGGQVELRAPDRVLRRRILDRLAETARARAPDLDVADDALDLIARRAPNDIRALQGAFRSAVSLGTGSGRPIDASLARDVLNSQYFEAERRIGISDIQTIVCRYYGITIDEMLAKRRALVVARPRQIAMFLCRELTRKSLPEIGRGFQRDHTTVVHAVRRIEELREKDAELDRDVERLRARIEQRGAEPSL